MTEDTFAPPQSITLNVSEFWLDIERTELNEEGVVAFLIADGVLFLGQSEKTLCLYVLCNDLFAWGSADCEEIAYKELEDLTRRYLKDGYDGVIAWCCIKRNARPQSPVEASMVRRGVWTEELEALPIEKLSTRGFWDRLKSWWSA